MSTVRYTKALKSELFTAVMKDQFDEEVKELEQHIKDVANEAAETILGDFDKRLREAFATVYKGANADEYCRRLSIFEYRNKHNNTPLMRVLNPYKMINSYSHERVFSLSLSCKLKREYIAKYDMEEKQFGYHSEFICDDKFADEHGYNLKPLHLRFTQLNDEINTVANNLVKVLDSVKSVKKLQEITKVFDPFIPKSASTSLLPTEALLAVNELKSPKHEEAKAA